MIKVDVNISAQDIFLDLINKYGIGPAKIKNISGKGIGILTRYFLHAEDFNFLMISSDHKELFHKVNKTLYLYPAKVVKTKEGNTLLWVTEQGCKFHD